MPFTPITQGVGKTVEHFDGVIYLPFLALAFSWELGCKAYNREILKWRGNYMSGSNQ